MPTSSAGTGTWTIKASGSDIWSVFDNFRYEYQPFPADPANAPNGDGTVSARVVSQTGYIDGYVKTGVMIRQGGTDPQAPYFGVFATPSNGVIVQWRPAEGAPTNQLLANPAGGNSNLPAVTPVYVLAERYTNTTTGVVYYSGFSLVRRRPLDLDPRIDGGPDPDRAAHLGHRHRLPQRRRLHGGHRGQPGPVRWGVHSRRGSAPTDGAAATSGAPCPRARTA